LVIDALGLPLVFEITEGQRHDSRPASELVQRAQSSCILADKAYDSDAFRAALDCQGSAVVALGCALLWLRI
jgi:transposase